MEEYLVTKELSQFIRESEGTIRNRVYKKEFVEGVHFIKPTPRKLLFIRRAIEEWLNRNSPKLPETDRTTTSCRINI